mmetsp:Transcript_2058/g.1860  ORF Transcript_2058/g.1860 Transcript_2058/m.1860 type:complete len:95 (+) Transcript_2058:63-347(+)
MVIYSPFSNFWYIFLSLGLFLFLFYPVLQETFLYLWQYMLEKSGCLNADINRIKTKIVDKHYIVYNKDYNITAFGVEKMHPFDSKKYGRIYEKL